MDIGEPSNMTCDEALRLVSASLDGEAALIEVDAVAEHLVACEACRLAAEAMESDDELLRRMGSQGDLRSTVARVPRPAASGKRWRSFGLAAAAVLALVAVGQLWRTSPESHDSAANKASNPTVLTTDSAVEVDRRQLDQTMQRADALVTSTTRPSSNRPSTNPFRDGRVTNPFSQVTESQGFGEERRRTAASPFGPGSSTRATNTSKGWNRGRNDGRWQRPATS